MKYKRTSESLDSLIYLGVRLFKDERGAAHTVLHYRAVDYPFQIDRYPEVSTVANPSQLGGVIMGRLLSAQRTCSRLDLFQDAVAGIFTHAHRRGYPRRLLHSTWSRFLIRYWDAASVTVRELRAWFHRVWKEIVSAEEKGVKSTVPTAAKNTSASTREGKMRVKESPSSVSQLMELLTPEDCRVPSQPQGEPTLDGLGIEDMVVDEEGESGRQGTGEIERESQLMACAQSSSSRDIDVRNPAPALPPIVVNVGIVGSCHNNRQESPPPPQVVERIVQVPMVVERPVLVPVERTSLDDRAAPALGPQDVFQQTLQALCVFMATLQARQPQRVAPPKRLALLPPSPTCPSSQTQPCKGNAPLAIEWHANDQRREEVSLPSLGSRSEKRSSRGRGCLRAVHRRKAGANEDIPD